MSIQITFEIGHEASIRTKKTPEGFTHDWEVFVRGANGTQLHYFVERVVFFLHETFPNPKRVVKQAPYVVKESGYAGFILPIEIHLKHSNEPKKIKFNYDLHLQTSGPAICKGIKEKYIFKNPSEEFRNCLLKGGGTPVSSNSFHETSDTRLSSDSKNELVNKPKLSGSDGMKQKHRNRIDDQRSSNSFQDLFGTPITKTNKVFSDPKSIPKDNTKSTTSNNNKPDKEKEKTSKDKSKFSPNKDREKTKEKSATSESTSDRKKDRGVDEKKAKEKDRKDRDRDHSKDKPPKRDKSPKVRSPSPKRPPSPPPKRSVTPPKYKEEKSTSKDRERKDKEEKSEKKLKREKRDKEHKERKSREKEIKNKEKTASKEEVEQKIKEKPKEFTEKDDKVDLLQRFEKKPEERKEKHKHKKKDKDKKDKEKKEKDKDRKDKEKVKMETKEVKIEEKESLFSSPKTEDRKKMSLFSSEQDLTNSSLSSAEEEPHFEPAVKKLKSEEKPKKEKSKKSKDRKAEKEEKKRKRKAERSPSEERPPKIVPKEETPVAAATPTTATKVPQESNTSDSEPAAAEVAVQTSNSVEIAKENCTVDSQEEYMEVLRGLQFKIMNLQDNSELQKVVQMIAQTGQYEVSQRTFDFDLCLLDKRTVRQLQDFFESIP